MRAALSFLTVAGGARPPDATTLDWFPVAGALIGALLGVVWWAAGRAWSPAPAAAVVVAADLVVTGMLHLDGLADSADGLLAPMERARRLAVMSAPDTGAFGTGAVAVVLLARWSAIESLADAVLWRDVLLLGGLWCLSRTSMAAVARWRPYARPGGGLASAFAGPRRPVVTAAGLVGAGVMLVGWHPLAGAGALGGGLAGGALPAVLGERRLGGHTGDVLGAGIVMAETAGLLVAAARW